MYRVIYYDDLNILTEMEFDTEAAARTFMAGLDWCRLITFSTSRTISDITTP